ncbi:MAG: cryptochrome/photolyase family protein [Paracoccaceae bacterium]
MSVNIVWFRRDLRLSDNPALYSATQNGKPIIPLFILDENTNSAGAAFKWRLGLSLESLSLDLQRYNSKLILRKGPPLNVLKELKSILGDINIFWNRLYDEASINRDTEIKSYFQSREVSVTSTEGMLLHSPWKTQTNSGTHYKVFTPFWRAISKQEVKQALPKPDKLVKPSKWPDSDDLKAWNLEKEIGRGKEYLIEKVNVGEKGARVGLETFLGKRLGNYAQARDRVDLTESSNLSENLAYGEISAREIWHSVIDQKDVEFNDKEMFIRQLAWRDFAWHLSYFSPHIIHSNWKAEWDNFPWRENEDELKSWKRGLTGQPIVDAGMREMYTTGRMHNRVRMIAASYLTKHLLMDWRLGLKWFEECLIDWDPASNAMGWQWVAGSGPDASPFFRVFNPELQAKKFDPEGKYQMKYLGSSSSDTHDSEIFYKMAPKSWNINKKSRPSSSIVDLKFGRDRALNSYSKFKQIIADL